MVKLTRRAPNANAISGSAVTGPAIASRMRVLQLGGERERRFAGGPAQQADRHRRQREAFDQQADGGRHRRALADDGVDRPRGAERQRHPRRRAEREALHDDADERERQRDDLRAR